MSRHGQQNVFVSRHSFAAFAFLVIAAWFGVADFGVEAQDYGHVLGREVLRLPIKPSAYNLAWSPNNRRVVVVSGTLGTRLVSFDVRRKTKEWDVYYPLTGGIGTDHIEFLENGNQILLPSISGRIVQRADRRDCINCDAPLSIVDALTGRVIRDLDPDKTIVGMTHDFTFSQDRQTMVVVPSQMFATRFAVGYSTTTWSPTWKIGPLAEHAIRQVLLDQEHDRLLLSVWCNALPQCAGKGDSIQVWKASDRRHLFNFQTYAAQQSYMILEPKTGRIITGGKGDDKAEGPPDRLVRAWDPATGNLVATYIGPGRGVEYLSLGIGGRYLVAARSRSIIPPVSDSFIDIWDVSTGRLVTASNYGQSFLDVAAISPDGKYIAVAANDWIQIIELNQGQYP